MPILSFRHVVSVISVFLQVLSNVYYLLVQNYLYLDSFVCRYKHLGYFNDLPLSKFVWIYVSSTSFPIKVSHPKVSKTIISNLLMTSILKSQPSLIACKASAQQQDFITKGKHKLVIIMDIVVIGYYYPLRIASAKVCLEFCHQ